MHGYPARLSRIEVDAIERGKSMNCKLSAARLTPRGIKVYLRDLIARGLASISQIETYVEAAVGSAHDLKRGVAKAGIGHAITKGIERFQVLMIVPPIAHKNAF